MSETHKKLTLSEISEAVIFLSNREKTLLVYTIINELPLQFSRNILNYACGQVSDEITTILSEKQKSITNPHETNNPPKS